MRQRRWRVLLNDVGWYLMYAFAGGGYSVLCAGFSSRESPVVVKLPQFFLNCSVIFLFLLLRADLDLRKRRLGVALFAAGFAGAMWVDIILKHGS